MESDNVAPLRKPMSDEHKEKLAAARAAGAVQRAEAAIEQELTVERAQSRADTLPKRVDLAKLATGVAIDILVKVLDGKIVIKNATEAKAVLELTYNITRLEAGESLSGSAMSREDLLASLKEKVDERRKASVDQTVKGERGRARRGVKPPEA